MKQEIAVTVDIVAFCNSNNKINVLLIKRKNDPFKGQWAIPGGFVDENENLENAAKREFAEETGIKVRTIEQVRAFGTPGRDPRGRTISIAFLCWIDCEENLVAGDDAVEAKWFKLDELPDLAFDHIEIIKAAENYL
ncbi:MAG: NUDIX hydrolase [Salegentibacter sp.]|uniref:8-oxo-dGTP diphosphatase n=1 Tax=Salegentibacter flavus TaxID=287099 RepID=A0A1I4Z618_9FLAO|nr:MULTISPECIES: NUDIX hydrolase [Salegentibacter]MDR9456211.1 NUDIX hydrolase [Salegentibacter sp.]SFN45722.1 8-oxo-dGTP diphosphatase [Salegentibacter flavus]